MTPRAAAPADPTRRSSSMRCRRCSWASTGKGVLDAGTRGVLERQALRPFLQRQRWFASKSREIRAGALQRLDAACATASAPGVPRRRRRRIRRRLDRDATSCRSRCSAASRPIAALHTTPGRVLARITGARKGAIVDGMLDDDTCERTARRWSIRRDERPTARGQMRGCHRRRHLERAPERAVGARIAATRATASPFADERYVLKLFRRIEPAATRNSKSAGSWPRTVSRARRR